VITIDWSIYNKYRKEYLPINSFHLIPIKSKNSFELARKKIGNESSVLDFGASDKHFKKYCDKKNHKLKKYKTIDIDKNVNPDFLSLDKVKEKFDYMTMFSAIEHIKFDDVLKILKKSSEKASNIIITTNNIYYPLWGFFDDITHVQTYSARSIYAILKISGYTDIKIYRNFEKNMMPTIIKKLISRITNQDFCGNIIAIAKNRKEAKK